MYSDKVSRPLTEPGTGRSKKDAAKGKSDKRLAKSVGTSKAKRDAALAKKRGMKDSSKPEAAKIKAEVERTNRKVYTGLIAPYAAG